MSNRLKKILLILFAAFALTVASVIVPRDVQQENIRISDSNGGCGADLTTVGSYGYPFGYFEGNTPITYSSPQSLPENCNAIDAASPTDTIAKHTPGHQHIFNFIENTKIDEFAFTQDFIIMTLIAIYPAIALLNYLQNRRRT